ncbi:MAG: sodium:proline symporter [Planctomycetota bacterium]|nr:MAG: sodium:proline symporter [Planctomycetota bacterium]
MLLALADTASGIIAAAPLFARAVVAPPLATDAEAEPVAGSALIAFVAYFALVVAIGLWAARRSSGGMGAFFLAGRSLNKWVVALSAVVSGRSSWLLLGVSGAAYARGVSALWFCVGYIVVEFLLFWDYARRLRRFAEIHDDLTLPDFLASRFPGNARLLRLLVVGLLLVFIPTYVGAQFSAGGKAFEAAFGMSASSGLWITAAIVLGYTVTGGFLAVSLTDMLQAVFMLVALVVLPLAAVISMGGFDALAEGLSALDPSLLDPFAISAVALAGGLAIGLGSPGNPHILVRYMSIDDPSQLRAAALVGTVWNTLMAAGALLIGLAARVAFPTQFLLATGGDPEQAYPVIASLHLAPVVYGLVIASIFAAIMSTADSQLLVAASAVCRDVVQKLLGRGGDERAMVRMSRLVVVALVLVAVPLGLSNNELILDWVLFAWAGLGAALGPTTILALYWKRCTGAGVAAGIALGGGVACWWRYVVKPGMDEPLYELIPGFAAGLLATLIVSLFTRAPAETEAQFKALRGET